MTDDHKRLLELEKTKGTLQYGQTLQITPSGSNPDLVRANQDLIRFMGEKTDVNAWRVYLGPWQPNPRLVIPGIIAGATYADPTPWAPPEPRNYDGMTTIQAYARVEWGSGGVQHEAFIDWPKRGLLFQVSGSYVQVNAFVDTLSSNISVTDLPLFKATLAPEPGGGDALSPATFTYPTENGELDVGPPITFTRFFQIPPMARSFVLVADIARALFTGSQYLIETKIFPLVGSGAIQSWITPVGGVFDQDFARVPFPIVGQEAGVVQVTRIGGGLVERFGLMFQLDM